jgi:hypothetical protein
MFQKYMHLERYGTDETLGMANGTDFLYVFPKLDGTNASVWYNESTAELRCGSRRRELFAHDDNRNFFKTINSEQGEAVKDILKDYPTYILYGEFLVSHSLKTYLDDAWEKFYVFDVYDRATDTYLPYEVYRPLLLRIEQAHSRIKLLPPLAIAKKLSIEDLKKAAEQNYYLMKEGSVGEGVVVKRYGYVNKYGRTVWGKYVRSEFKAQHIAEMGPRVINSEESIEEKIVDRYVTQFLVDKTIEKLRDEHGFEGTLPGRIIPQLLGTVWYDLVTEEVWGVIKEYNFPTINFKQLHKLCYKQTKYLAGIS